MRLQKTFFFIASITTSLLHASSEAGNQSRSSWNLVVSDPTSAASSIEVQEKFPDGIKPMGVQDAGNENDPETGLGMVIEPYSIAQTEVTAKQYCYYLNQVATGENYELFYHEKMGTDPNVASIRREVVDGKNHYTIIQDPFEDRGCFPIVYVSLYQAARFCNWLQNKDTPGLTNDDLTERGAYTLNGSSSGPIARNPGAVWFIPTENEWYKPAYYKGHGLDSGYWDFSNRSDWAPSNGITIRTNGANYAGSFYTKKGAPYLTSVKNFSASVGAYNTYDMSGNAAEWVATEENQGAIPMKYVARGGSWRSSYYGSGLQDKYNVANWGVELSKWSRPAYDPTQGYDHIGFRVATSLVAPSVSPKTAPPGASELSPIQTLEAPFLIFSGCGLIFSGKKIYECRKNAEKIRRTAERQKIEQDEERRATQPSETESSYESMVKDQERLADISVLVEEPIESPKKPLITEEEKVEEEKVSIEMALEEIDTRFIRAAEACEKNSLIFLKKKQDIQWEDMKKLEGMCISYDCYATAVLESARKLKECFSEKKELWVPWYTTALDVLSEAMILRHGVVKSYVLFGQFPQFPVKTQKEILRLRKDSNKKALEYHNAVQNYKTLLDAAVRQDEGGTCPEITAALEFVAWECRQVSHIQEAIENHEPQDQENKEPIPSSLNGAYQDYEKGKSRMNANISKLFFVSMEPVTASTIVPLVQANQMPQKVRAFLNQQQEVTSPLYSPLVEWSSIYGPRGSTKSQDNPKSVFNFENIKPRQLDQEFKKVEEFLGDRQEQASMLESQQEK